MNARIALWRLQFDYIRFSTGKGMSEAYFSPSRGKSKEDIIIEFTKQA